MVFDYIILMVGGGSRCSLAMAYDLHNVQGFVAMSVIIDIILTCLIPGAAPK